MFAPRRRGSQPISKAYYKRMVERTKRPFCRESVVKPSDKNLCPIRERQDKELERFSLGLRRCASDEKVIGADAKKKIDRESFPVDQDPLALPETNGQVFLVLPLARGSRVSPFPMS